MKTTRRQLRRLINEEIRFYLSEAFSQDKEDEAREKIVQAVDLALGGFKRRTFLNPKEVMALENGLMSVGLNPDDFNIDPGHQLPRGRANRQGQPCTVAIYLDRHAYHFEFDRKLGIREVDRT